MVESVICLTVLQAVVARTVTAKWFHADWEVIYAEMAERTIEV